MTTGRGRIAWFVSAHGWGHASRQREVIREVLARRPGTGISLVTGVPPWFWAGLPGIRLDQRGAGPVPVESSGATDMALTAAKLSLFLEGWREILDRETLLLEAEGAGLVVSDIDAIPFAAADKAGIPSIGLASFTWDWLFGRLIEGTEAVCGLLSRLYRTGCYIRLPLGPAEHPFRCSTDIPLLPGGVPVDPDRARRLLGREGPVMVITLRDARVLAGPIVAPRGWQVVTSLPEPLPGATINITPFALEGLGLRFSDLVACADTVLLTPGYGIVSQVLAGGVRAVVTRRHGFPETPFLMESLEGRPGTVVREASELAAHGLGAAADLSLEGPAPQPVPCGGVEAAAGMILEALEGGTPGRPCC